MARIAESLIEFGMGRKTGRALWFWIGLAILAAVIASKELGGALYFADDDNLVQFLPVIQRGCAYFFSTGHLPTWNPYGQMGAPTFAVGTYALGYPGTYLSCAIAGAVWRADATLDVFTILHLLGAYVGLYLLCRALGVRPSISSLAAITWVACSIIGVSGWYYMVPALTYGPFVLWALVTAPNRKPWSTVAILGALWGLFGLSGNVQIFLYFSIFWWAALVLLVGGKKITGKDALRAASGFFAGIAIMSFAIIPQLVALVGIVRHGKAGYVLPLLELKAFLIPEPFVGPPDITLSETPQFHGVWFYVPVLAVAGMWATLAAPIGKRFKLAADVKDASGWGALGLIATVLALGPMGGLWTVLSLAPKFDQFQHAAKFLWPGILLLTVAGAIAAQRLLTARSVTIGFFALALIALAVPTFHPRWVGAPDDGHYTDNGFPPLPGAAARLIHSGGRVFAVAPARSHLPHLAWGQGLAFSTAYGILNASGYDPLVAALPEGREMMAKLEASYPNRPVDVLRDLGVRWIVVHKAAYNPPVTLDWDELYHMGRFMPAVFEGVVTLPIAYRNADIAIYRVDGARPLACKAPCSASLPIIMNEGGIDISLSPGRSDVSVNFLLRRGMAAFVDGLPIALEIDDLGRILAKRVEGQKLIIKQTIPWGRAWIAALAMLMISGALYSVARFKIG